MNQAPLNGLRIVDLTRLLPGPFATRVLADLGADVIKVESPDGGDYLRYAPPLAGRDSAHFSAVNIGKRSLAVDLKNPAGREALRRVLANADALIEGFRPGVMARFGLAYEQLRDEYPRLVYLSLTGYGHTGPYRDRAGHDANYLALAGVQSLTGRADGRLAIPGVPVADLAGALYAATALIAACFGRARTGHGCFVDLALADAVQSLQAMPFAAYFAAGEIPGPADQSITGKYVCYDLYPTRDGRFMSLCALEPKFWWAFCDAVGKPHLRDEGFSLARPGDPAYEELRALFASRTMLEWTEIFAAVDCCCEPVLRVDEAAAHPQFQARERFRPQRDYTGDVHTSMNNPCRFTPPLPPTERPAPGLGEHTAQVLREAGLADDRIADLARRGAFGPRGLG